MVLPVGPSGTIKDTYRIFFEVTIFQQILVKVIFCSFGLHYVDSDSACSAIDRKSTSRCYFSMRSSVISWFRRKESFMLKYCNFEEYYICIFLWSPMVLPGDPLALEEISTQNGPPKMN